jgi:hypothetical protein
MNAFLESSSDEIHGPRSPEYEARAERYLDDVFEVPATERAYSLECNLYKCLVTRLRTSIPKSRWAEKLQSDPRRPNSLFISNGFFSDILIILVYGYEQ